MQRAQRHCVQWVAGPRPAKVRKAGTVAQERARAKFAARSGKARSLMKDQGISMKAAWARIREQEGAFKAIKKGRGPGSTKASRKATRAERRAKRARRRAHKAGTAALAPLL